VSGDELPEGWASTTLSTICTHRSGSSKLIKGRLEAGPGPTLFKAFSASGQDVWCKSWEHEGSAVVVSAVGARCGKAFKADGQWAAIANTHIVWAGPSVDTDFLFLHLNNEQFWERGGSAQPFVKVTATFDRDFSLPPLAEQKRIVAKVEELMVRVNAARERLVRVPAILKRFRQAVLAAACEGRLTEGWSVSHRGTKLPSAPVASAEAEGLEMVLPEGWVRTSVGALGEVVDPQPSHRTPPMEPNGVPYVGIGDIDLSGKVDISGTRKVSASVLAEHRARYSLKPGDFVFGKIGTLGRPTTLPEPFDYALSANLVLVQPRRHCIPNYLLLFMQSPVVARLLVSASRATSQAAFGIKRIRNLAVPAPSISEQREIVRRVEALFKLADTIEKRVAAATARAEKLTQAILAKAFRGDLVPTEAELARREGRAYEPAAALLERVKGQGAVAAGAGRRQAFRPKAR
jgi:type I restriction enzyme, S subunit